MVLAVHGGTAGIRCGWLLAAGLDEAEVALKTSEVNDLDKPENANLLSPQCRVRVIITKAALQEGWDCPFAYVLCSLAANGNESAMTQLVGRILRQPHAMRIGGIGEQGRSARQSGHGLQAGAARKIVRGILYAIHQFDRTVGFGRRGSGL